MLEKRLLRATLFVFGSRVVVELCLGLRLALGFGWQIRFERAIEAIWSLVEYLRLRKTGDRTLLLSQISHG